MKVIYEETKGRLLDHGYHFKLYGRSQEHNEQYYMPYLLMQQTEIGGEPSALDWSIIKATDNADAIRQVIKLIDSQAVPA